MSLKQRQPVKANPAKDSHYAPLTRLFNDKSETLRKSSRGFTIIELMIATAVLSVILVMVTVIMINIGHLYYKGINQARVQDDTRSITDDVAAHIELGGVVIHVVSGNKQAYCIGNTRYTFILNKQISSAPGAGQSAHVLWRDDNPTPGGCSAVLPNLNLLSPPPSANGTELIAPNSRLTDFTITGSPPTNSSPYNVTVGVAYGDNDLICDIGFSGDCSTPSGNVSAHMTQIVNGATPASGAIRCKGSAADQFCATSILHTTVTRRLP